MPTVSMLTVVKPANRHLTFVDEFYTDKVYKVFMNEYN